MNYANLLTTSIRYAQLRRAQNCTLSLDHHNSISINIDASLTYYWSCVEIGRSSHVNSLPIDHSYIRYTKKEKANKFAIIKLAVAVAVAG
ncbi:hypothetical protein T12_13884 [Trichinella patagoniensis]|uniref:Uncharacterized protein n=1 Tax=Trichinella patagoniensis TaxID=990121 RepID=A0A0V1ADN7_9BILA|nr:hypothetical protein T12_13884 [Trichinella patagoniensis]